MSPSRPHGAVTPGPGQESVWDYPRPPACVPIAARVRVIHRGVTIVAAPAALRVLETSHPPTYCVAPDTLLAGAFVPSAARSSFCEWKGRAVYWDLHVAGVVVHAVGWSYPDPTPAFAALRDHVAIYASRVDRCEVDGEPVAAQPGDFYGGWITSKVVGPFKGAPGTWGW